VSRARAGLGALGVLAAAYGGWLLLSRQDTDRNLDALLWLAGGVLVHDALLAPALLALCWVGARLLPAVARPAAAAGLVVLGSLTLLAVPFLGGFGRDNAPDNGTLLDRDYTAGFLVLVGVVLVAVVLPVLLHTVRTARAGAAGAGAEDR
jgi:hypothetical protein